MIQIKSTDDIRACFPALIRTHNGNSVAFFDGPGGTQVPQSVVEAMSDYLLRHNANTHWCYPTSEETDAIIDSARTTVGGFLNAAPNEIAFGANMTTLTFHLARALAREYKPGDEIVVTELDHHANIAPWKRLEKENGVRVRMAKMIPETGQLDWPDFESKIGARTKLVAVGAASNALGTINDVSRAIAIARQAGARVFVDAVHYAPHRLVDVQEWGCDFLACSAYKFYGPHIGVLYARSELLETLDFPKLLPAPDTGPERVETGTQNHEGIAGAAAAIQFLASLAPSGNTRERLTIVFEQLEDRASNLTQRLWDGLSNISGVRLFGPPPDAPRTPTVAFVHEKISSTDVAKKLATRGIFASHGDFYALTIIERLGLLPEGVVRIGCACYTTEEEIDRMIDAIESMSN